MKHYIQSFPDHISDAVEIAEGVDLGFDISTIRNIVISGQGGSGIGGVIAKNILQSEINLPIYINQDYSIPAFVDQNTLFIASSYSGQTEETLQALKYAIKKESKIFCLCSGGEMLDVVKGQQLNHILIPAGGMPRAMLCYSMIQILFILSKFHKELDFCGQLRRNLKVCQSYLLKEQLSIIETAQIICDKIDRQMPFIYTFPEFEGLALRFKQQLNENSKRHAVYNIIPEMNHNEIVAWEKHSMCVFPIFIDGNSSKRNKDRLEINIDQISKKVEDYMKLTPNTSDYLQQYFYYIHLVDWVSLLVAEKDSVDPGEIKSIDYLKKELKNL